MKTDTTEQLTCTVTGCSKPGPYKNQKALNMHNARVHTKKIKAPFQGLSKEERRLAKRRAYQKKLRKRYKAEGKDSRGYPLKGGRHKKKFGAPWTVERRKKFDATWAAKKNGKLPPPLKLEEQEDPRQFIRHCPNCGANLVPHFLAAGIAQRETH